jgi:hypothetical protein
MMKNSPSTSSFLLLDSALLGARAVLFAPDAYPDWVIPVYKGSAAAVGPLVLDIEGAHLAGQVEWMMALVNDALPQLHCSLIDTTLSHEGLARHLRQFICVETAAGNQLTLRFADCAVLPALADAFSAEQWSTLAAPLACWRVHRRDGTLLALPAADLALAPLPIPLVLDERQIGELKEAMAADQLVVNVQNFCYGRVFPGTVEQQRGWASAARDMWRAAGQIDGPMLLLLASAVIDTRGAMLDYPGLPALLAQTDSALLERDLHLAADSFGRSSRRA